MVSPPHKGRILGVVGLALMMVVSAVSGLNVALPNLARDTGATQSQVQWIVDAYTMVFAGLLLAAGAVGDRFGRRGILMAGLMVFGAAAGAGMLITEPTALIALRGVMGVGAACVMPTTLSIITSSFSEAERPQAVGVWVGIAGGGAVLGLLVSGVLLEFFDWNSFFALNVTLAALALAGTIAFIPDSREEHPSPLDAGGGVLSLVGVSALVFGIIEGPERGWSDPLVLGALALALAALSGFVGWEARQQHPLLDPRLFRRPGFGTGSLSITAQFFASFGFFYIVIQYLQYVAGLSPLVAALAILPMPLVLIPLARRAPLLAPRLGINRLGGLGLALISAGLTTIALTLSVDFVYWQFASGLVVFAAGAGLAGTPATTAIVSSLPPEKQGVASAVNDVSREFGSALGIALLGSVLNSSYRSGVAPLTTGLPAEAGERLESSIAALSVLPLARLGTAGERVRVGAEQAFVDAASLSLLVAAALLIVAATYVVVRAPRRADVPAEERRTSP